MLPAFHQVEPCATYPLCSALKCWGEDSRHLSPLPDGLLLGRHQSTIGRLVGGKEVSLRGLIAPLQLPFMPAVAGCSSPNFWRTRLMVLLQKHQPWWGYLVLRGLGFCSVGPFPHFQSFKHSSTFPWLEPWGGCCSLRLLTQSMRGDTFALYFYLVVYSGREESGPPKMSMP